MKRKRYADDDGRVISNMNIEGAPWYVKPLPGGSSGNEPGPALSWREMMPALWGALSAGLMIGLIFVGAAFLFILFCVFVWLR